MTLQARVDVAQQYRALSDRLISEHEDAAAGEMLWGAVHNAIQAIAIRHSLIRGTDGALRRAVVIQHLMERHGHDLYLRSGLRSAGSLHGHFYNRNLSLDTHRELMLLTRSYVDSLIVAALPA
jgi:hypothetical protein